MFKRLAIDPMIGTPMFNKPEPEAPQPEAEQGQPTAPEQNDRPPVQPGNGLPIVSDLNPQSAIGYRRLKVRG